MLPISFLYLILATPTSPNAPPTTQSAPEASDVLPVSRDVLVVRARRLILSPGSELQNGALRIEGGRIVEVGTDVATPAGARELTGEVACAGFIDPWSSLGLEPAAVADMQTDPATLTTDGVDPWHAPHLHAEALSGGVTSVRTQAGRTAPVGGIGCLLTVGDEGPVVLLEDACVSATVGLSRPKTMDVFDRIAEVDRLCGLIEKGRAYQESLIEYRHELEAWEKEIAEKEAELEDDFKKAKKKRDKDLEKAEEDGKEFKEKRYREDKKPKQPKYDPAAEVMARVTEGELPLVVEVHRSAELRRLLARTADFDRLRLVISGATEAAGHADELAARRIPAIVWPAPLGDGRADEYAEHDLSLAGELARAGVTVLLGSGGEPHARELRLLAGLAASFGLDRDAALAAITQAPARVFDVSDRVGTLAEGMDADVLVLDGDPLEATSRILYCLSKGEVVGQ